MILSIDLGGRSIKIGLFNKNGKLVHKFIVKTYIGQVIEKCYEGIIQQLEKINVNYNQIEAIGFGCVGPIDHEKGISVFAEKIGWRNYPAREIAYKLFRKPIFLINDARAAILGEYWAGGGKNYKNVIGYTIGTGVGGCVIIDGKIYRGSHNWAGEFGHGGLFHEERKCSCGLIGCVEGSSSANGIEDYLQKYIKERPWCEVAKLQDAHNHKLTIKDIAPLIKQKEPSAIAIIHHGVKALSSNIGAMIYAFDPDVILIGGGPSALGQDLLDAIYSWLYICVKDFVLEKVKVRLCQLGNDAGMYGAAYCALQGLKEKK